MRGGSAQVVLDGEAGTGRPAAGPVPTVRQGDVEAVAVICARVWAWLCRVGVHWTRATGETTGLADLHEERVCRHCEFRGWYRVGP